MLTISLSSHRMFRPYTRRSRQMHVYTYACHRQRGCPRRNGIDFCQFTKKQALPSQVFNCKICIICNIEKEDVFPFLDCSQLIFYPKRIGTTSSVSSNFLLINSWRKLEGNVRNVSFFKLLNYWLTHNKRTHSLTRI